MISENPEVGTLLRKYLKGAKDVPVGNRIRMLRLAEKMAMESADVISDIHGGGSPAAHRLTIFRESDLDEFGSDALNDWPVLRNRRVSMRRRNRKIFSYAREWCGHNHVEPTQEEKFFHPGNDHLLD